MNEPRPRPPDLDATTELETSVSSLSETRPFIEESPLDKALVKQDATTPRDNEYSTIRFVEQDAAQDPMDLQTLPGVAHSIATSDSKNRSTDFGDYELLGEIARGGMGVVYRARQKKLNRIVALKMILAGNLASEVDIKRFYAEAEAAARLDHTGIVPIYEVNQRNSQHYFAMGFVDGPSLACQIRDQSFTPRQAAEIAIAIADAVEYAHQCGIIHRDLKPQNILMTSTGQPKVTDFGLAKHLGHKSDLTSSGQILGTPNYMAPEQAAGQSDEIGPGADVYALGGILYCMLVGKPPFQGKNLTDTLLQVQFTEVTAVSKLNSKVHRDLETICLKALSKTPSLRYLTAAAFAEDLRRFCDGEPIQGRRESWHANILRRAKRNRVVSLSVFAVSMVVILATWIVWRSSEVYQLASLNQRLEAELETSILSDQKIKEIDEIASAISRIAPDNAIQTAKRINDKLIAFVNQKINQPRLDQSNIDEIERWIDVIGKRFASATPALQESLQQRVRAWEPVMDLKAPFTGFGGLFPNLKISNDGKSIITNAPVPTFHLASLPSTGDVVFEADFLVNPKSESIGLILSGSPGHATPLSAMLFDSTGSQLLTASASLNHDQPGELILWDISRTSVLSTFRAPLPGAPLVILLPNDKVAIVAIKGQPKLWKLDLVQGEWAEWQSYEEGTGITHLESSTLGNRVAITATKSDSTTSIDVWDVSSQAKTLPKNVGISSHHVELLKVHISGDELVWYSNKLLHHYSLVNGVSRDPIECPDLKDISPDLDSALVFSSDHCEVWNVSTNKRLKLPRKDQGSFRSSAFSLDGQSISIADFDRDVTYSVTTGLRIYELVGRESLRNSYSVRSTFSSDGRYLATAFDDFTFVVCNTETQSSTRRIGMGGYSFLVKLPNNSQESNALGRGKLQLLRNNQVLRSQDVRLPEGQIHLIARREGDLLTIQLNDAKPIEFSDIFPLSSSEFSAFGIWLGPSDQILNVKARRKMQSSSPSKLEAADIAFSQGEYTRALQLYAEQNANISDLQTVQESTFKQSLSLTALERHAEADELLSNLAIQGGDRWPPYAACKLWLRRLQQKKQSEADQLFEFITSRFKFDEFVSMIPEDVRHEIILQYREATVDAKLFIPNPNRVKQSERSVEVKKLLFQFGGEFQLIRAYHMAGRNDEALVYGEQVSNQILSKTHSTENVGGCIQEYLWLLRLHGKANLGLSLIDRFEQSRDGTPDVAGWLCRSERVRCLVAISKMDEAEEEAERSLVELKKVGNVRREEQNATPLSLMLGFLRERRGDEQGALEAWRSMPDEDWDKGELGLSLIHNHILASCGKQMSNEQSQSLLNRIIGSVGDSGKIFEVSGVGASIVPGFAELFQSPRGKRVAYEIIFRTVPLATVIRSYPQLTVYETLRRNLLTLDSPASHDSIIWETCGEGIDLYMAGKLSGNVIVPLVLSWKGTTGFLGWGAAGPSLPKDFRAKFAFVLGIRYERLGRPKDAITFFQQALNDGEGDSVLAQEAQRQIDRLNESN